MSDAGERDHLPSALVTGACGVMGIAITRRLATRHLVYVADINRDAAIDVAARLRTEGASAIALECDVTDPVSVTAMMAEISSRSSRLAVLSHVVGLSPSMAQWDTILRVNLQGAARVVDAVAPLMGSGSAAVLISSVGGHMVTPTGAELALLEDPLCEDFFDRLLALRGAAPDTVTAYQLSKHGLMKLARRLAPEWGKRGARILTLSPGFIATAMGDLEFRNQPAKREFMNRMPIPRQGSVIEIADAVKFLSSDKASYITGTDLLIDGGMSAIL